MSQARLEGLGASGREVELDELSSPFQAKPCRNSRINTVICKGSRKEGDGLRHQKDSSHLVAITRASGDEGALLESGKPDP